MEKTKAKTNHEFKPTIIVDAGGAAAGRVSSYAAKQALLGKTLAIVNCDNAIITGNRGTSVIEFREMRQRGGHSLKGPFYPKHPEKIMKRMVRGMLRYTRGRGEAALSRVRCFNNIPKEFEAAKKVTLVRESKGRSTTLSDLSREI
jgi:large subunit ribosomal protein L13